MTAQQPTCEYLRTLEGSGTFCIIKDDWVDVTVCNNCPANRSRPAPAQQPEYIITEEQLISLFWDDPDASIIKAIRSRPVPEQKRFKIVESVPDKNNIVIMAVQERPDGEFTTRDDALVAWRMMQEAKAEAARAATLKTLDKLQAWRREREHADEDVAAGWIDEDVFIESLRQQAGEQE